MLSEGERAAVNPGAMFSDGLYEELTAWAVVHYREELAPGDLADPDLVDEAQGALDALTQIMKLGSDFYPFQRA